ncbi:hypothetical protein [Streptomyces sp. fd1-xmd]|uniref:hypothetical protein n=1 Tax=Streptomyces sp. fd1-xmd TaxID=1812480 RepID=UPI0013520EC0|nr:hypothetical protein [Streptomyces sp. fd1-xmd]
MARARDHVGEVHPGADIPEALRLAPDVAFPPADFQANRFDSAAYYAEFADEGLSPLEQ